MDRLTSMSVFIAVVEKGSFVAAADVMNMSPTMVGKHIGFLERRLKAKLLVRTTRRQGLTEAGQLYYEHCRRLVRDADNAEALVNALQATPVGQIRITAPYTLGNHVITPLVTRFLKRYPELRVEIMLADRKVDMIEEGFDFAFRIGDIMDEGLVARALPDYEMMLAATPEYLATYGSPETPAALKHHHCLGFSQREGGKFWQLIGAEEETGSPMTPRLVVNSGEGGRQAALAGFGIVFQSKVILERDIRDGTLVRVLADYPPPTRPLHMLYLPQKEPVLKFDAFSAFMLEHLYKRLTALSAL
ncbi:LysR family transcriptional regulator [Enterobacillus tribolii]|uniref:LysR family transcriptional regulator n=1 Tax=Enterobacillus tribolii TaxID=1487935 RepID=A0A370QQJ1_9GAMM|nr:LysR family transcriptional regulator [Enterobacillus tribolii]MBW7981679.1 LysR family transcriptional regulator [Enterobacillus tribolii]RDK91058.1 LysR family transcriptional regulator [Enterobacillus tribolii]